MDISLLQRRLRYLHRKLSESSGKVELIDRVRSIPFPLVINTAKIIHIYIYFKVDQLIDKVGATSPRGWSTFWLSRQSFGTDTGTGHCREMVEDRIYCHPGSSSLHGRME